MGWLFKPGITRQELIAEQIKGWERTKEDGTDIKLTCIAHCYRGGVFSGVLWSVWERTFTKNGQQTDPPQRWIICDLMRCVGGEWGYKDIEESMHPFYYSCPLSYLNLVPIDPYGGNAQWRELVRQHHARIAEKRRSRKAIKS